MAPDLLAGAPEVTTSRPSAPIASPGVPGSPSPAAVGVLAARRRRLVVTTAALAVVLVVLVVVSVALGQYLISPGDLWPLLVGGPHGSGRDASIIWAVRLPRIALAVCVGAALGAGGALMQALFANPLAEPGVIGVSSGAAVGASAAIVLGGPSLERLLGSSAVPVCSFVTGVLATAAIYRLARVRGQSLAVALVLVGVTVNAVAGAVTSFITFLAPTTARDQVVFWQMGSLNGAQWGQVALVAPVVAVSVCVSVLLAPGLDVLALGDRAAAQTGVEVGALRRRVVVVTALLTAAAVSYAGIIGFVGLIVPHLLRLVLGPRNRVLVPVSALGGAVLVTGADLAARTLVPFADLPIGIFTALVGGPTFFVLLRRTLREGGL